MAKTFQRKRLFSRSLALAPTVKGIAFDAASASGVQVASSSYTWQHTCTGANRALVVKISILSAGASVSALTYNSVALTLIRADTNGVDRTELWGLLNPSSGTNTIAVTLSGSITSSGAATSYTNVDQTNGFEAHHGTTGTNTPATDSVTTISAGAWIVGGMTSASASGVTSAAGQRTRDDTHSAAGTAFLDDLGPVTPPSSTALTWNGLGALDTWAVSLVALRPLVAVNAVSGDGSAAISFSASGVGASIFSAAGTASITFGADSRTPTLGVGSASVTLSGTGVGASTAAGAGAASLAFTDTGVGAANVAGAGAASVTIAATGAGTAVTASAGSAAVTFAGSGTGAANVAGAGSATITFAAAGDATPGGQGAGAAAVAFAATGVGASVRAGAGAASLTLTATAAGGSLVATVGSATLRITATGAAPTGTEPLSTVEGTVTHAILAPDTVTHAVSATGLVTITRSIAGVVYRLDIEGL